MPNSMLPHHENFNEEHIQTSSDKMRRWLGNRQPTLAVVLGSRLGGFGRDMPGVMEAGYRDFALSQSHVTGHANILRYVPMGKQAALVFDGRTHIFEGYDFRQIVRGIRAAAMLGVNTYIITSASRAVSNPEGVNPKYQLGDLVLITDYLDRMGGSPLEGDNDEKIGPRFLDMTYPYDLELFNIAKSVMVNDLGMHRAKLGVYAARRGPAYETAAEVRNDFDGRADLIGMSTLPEVTALQHMGKRVLAISCVNSYATGILSKPSSVQEIEQTIDRARPRLHQLLTGIINRLPG